MKNIPQKALSIGAETINQSPVKYNKSRISGSKLTTYNLHSRAIFMPGLKEKFTPIPGAFNDFNSDIIENKYNRAYKLNNEVIDKKIIGSKYHLNHLDKFTFSSYSPNDDEALEIAIKASYRHIFGNLHPMDSERPIDPERRLRNGDITIKQFIREISKSDFYLQNYFYKISQLKCIEITFKHILGRPPLDQDEIIKSILIMKEKGFESHIDFLLDSSEYQEVFGEDTVPYMRGWSSEVGLTTSVFLKTSNLTRSFATSDITFC